MAKLIIQHGDRVIEHELGEDSVVIGRDPDCSLYFTDRKLSRHHARIVRSPEGGFQIVDLGSRNGSWVNDERVEERQLQDRDEIRLGSLTIAFENPATAAGKDVGVGTGASAGPSGAGVATSTAAGSGRPSPEPSPDSDATVHLGGTSVADLSRPPNAGQTVRLDAPSSVSTDSTATIAPGAAPAGSESDSATRVLGDATQLHGGDSLAPAGDESSSDGSATMERPASGATVAFSAEAPKKKEPQTGTVVFRAGQQQPISPPPVPPTRTSVVGEGPEEGQVPGQVGELASPLPHERPAPPGVLRIAVMLAALAALAVVVLALPLARMTRAAVDEQTRLRGQTLAELLATSNARIAAEGRRGELRVERALREPGVSDAFLVDRSGRVLAPADHAGDTLESLDSLAELTSDGLDPARIRTARTFPISGGRRVFVAPMIVDGQLFGISIVNLADDGGATSVRPLVVVVLGALLLLVGAAAAALVASRLLLFPMERLREDIDAATEGRLLTIGIERPYRELEELAFSVARWLGTAEPEDAVGPPGAGGDATVLADGAPDPTVVPGNSDQR